MQIEDGTGSGRLAEVNGDNHLVVLAVTEDEMEFISHNTKQSWILSVGDIVTSASEKAILHLKYTGSTSHFHIRSVILSCSGNGWFRVRTRGILGGGVLLTNLNLNINCGVTNEELIVMSGTAPMTYTSGTLVTSYYNSQVVSLYSGLIIGFSSEICITHEGVDAGSLIAVSILGYEEEL